MPSSGFHNAPFDESTLAKLRLFEFYARAWLPVFLSQPRPHWREIHVFDFFAGPGQDSIGVDGSPLRILKQLAKFKDLPGWSKVDISVHLFDADIQKIALLQTKIAEAGLEIPRVTFEIKPLKFREAFLQSSSILSNRNAAKLIFIDQFGVSEVTDDIFQNLVHSPTCDFLFFISSSTLNRFHTHPAIKQKITRPNDYYHVHRAALHYYSELLPKGQNYYLAPFSVKKGANIYGLIFGSAHPMGIDKFLEIAWKEDAIYGEANFNIDRENSSIAQPSLFSVNKLITFETELEGFILDGTVRNEAEVIRVCFDHGVLRRHAAPVLDKLRREGWIELSFRVPQIKRLSNPLLLRLKDRPR